MARQVRSTSTINNIGHISSDYHPDMARPPVSLSGYNYLALVGIGTFPSPNIYKSYFFLIDSGSDIVWLQCQGCDPCFPQVGGPYPVTGSATYREFPCIHPSCIPALCHEKNRDICAYEVNYADNSSTYGVLASETLTVNSDDGSLERIENFVFGCGTKQERFIFGHDIGPTEIAGILGLGGNTYSFLQQLGDRGQMKFSYCFQLGTDKWASSSNTFLRFGSDADHIGGLVQTTPMFFARGETVYNVNLYDISIGEKRIGYPPGSFVVQREGVGGCAFDSGAPLTLIAPEFYDTYERSLIQDFAALNVHTTDDHDEPGEYETCFTMPDGGFNGYPSITFHFKDADFEIEPDAAFYKHNDIFCSAILRDDVVPDGFAVLFGAVQQANHRVLYDINNRKISWEKEKCVSP